MIDIPFLILVGTGLTFFEIVSSIDNAVINADVLSTMSRKGRQWFLFWGVLIAVFVVRGGLPILIVYSLNPSAGLVAAVSGALGGDPAIATEIQKSAPPLLIAAGTFLILLFLHWLFLEGKEYGLRGEEFIQKKGAWFFAIASLILTLLIWVSINQSSILAFGTAVGSSIFFVVHGFRENSEQRERQMIMEKQSQEQNGSGELSKLLYLEVIDASFSIDGILGAFAFTFYVPPHPFWKRNWCYRNQTTDSEECGIVEEIQIPQEWGDVFSARAGFHHGPRRFWSRHS